MRILAQKDLILFHELLKDEIERILNVKDEKVYFDKLIHLRDLERYIGNRIKK
jgi:hypothetical protein